MGFNVSDKTPTPSDGDWQPTGRDLVAYEPQYLATAFGGDLLTYDPKHETWVEQPQIY